MQDCGLWRLGTAPRLALQCWNDKYLQEPIMITVSNPITTQDIKAFKTAVREQWDRSAEGWNDHTSEIRAWLRQASDAMLDMAGIVPGASVLDVAAGAGDQTLDIAQRIGPQGHVLATDLSPGILALAQKNARQAGFHNVQTLAADGEDLQVEPASFDAVVCRLGLMFFPDPMQGLHGMRRALRPGGRICTMVFSRPESNPCIGILMSTALKYAGMPARDPFQPGGLLSLGKPGLADELFRAAGFQNVATTALDAPFRLPTVRHYLNFIRSSASPIQQILGHLAPKVAAAAWAEMEDRLTVFNTANDWVGPNELLLTAGQR
jgi:ubiquinone/menaquinone biosynthesis C-methylase UbiE